MSCFFFSIHLRFDWSFDSDGAYFHVNPKHYVNEWTTASQWSIQNNIVFLLQNNQRRLLFIVTSHSWNWKIKDHRTRIRRRLRFAKILPYVNSRYSPSQAPIVWISAVFCLYTFAISSFAFNHVPWIHIEIQMWNLWTTTKGMTTMKLNLNWLKTIRFLFVLNFVCSNWWNPTDELCWIIFVCIRMFYNTVLFQFDGFASYVICRDFESGFIKHNVFLRLKKREQKRRWINTNIYMNVTYNFSSRYIYTFHLIKIIINWIQFDFCFHMLTARVVTTGDDISRKKKNDFQLQISSVYQHIVDHYPSFKMSLVNYSLAAAVYLAFWFVDFAKAQNVCMQYAMCLPFSFSLSMHV